MRRFILVSCVFLASTEAWAQGPPAFEVASIRRNVSGSRRGSTQLRPGGRLVVVNENLRSLVRDAYGQSQLEVVGGPKWIDTDTWDVAATAGRTVSDDESWAMLRALLEQRFKLVARRETREQPVYVLLPANDTRPGSQLRVSSLECPVTGNSCGTQSMPGRITGSAADMSDLVRSLSRVVGRPVVDRTGLAGRFDFTLTWTPDVPGGSTPVAVVEGGSIFSALQEQLSLKLESQRAPVDVIVVDSAERPVED
jgi:uncharacterized protein (TIGR03435 family)